MRVSQIRVGTMANFVYLVVDEKTREGVVIDSGWETKPIVDAAQASGARVRYVVVTHEHFDHASTVTELAGALGAEVVAHVDSTVECDVRVADGGEVRFGGDALRVIHTPGHTEDSICLYGGGGLFTGDTLFVGTIGRFERPKAEAMYHSLYKVIMKLPDSTVFYPGHDYGEVPFRTLGEERGANPYLMAGELRSFLSLFA